MAGADLKHYFAGALKPLKMSTTFSRDLRMITTVDLRYYEDANTKPVYNFVYASQLYGTLFALYGRFVIEEAADKSSCVVKQVVLDLYNYVGAINMGFTADQPVFDTSSKDGPCIFFGCRGASMLRQKTVPFPADFIVRKGEHVQISFDRVLYPLPDFTYEPTELRDMSYPLKEQVPETPIFDTEFQGRSGADYFNNPERPGMAGHKEGTDKLTMENLVGQRLKIASPRCTQSIVNLVYT